MLDGSSPLSGGRCKSREERKFHLLAILRRLEGQAWGHAGVRVGGGRHGGCQRRDGVAAVGDADGQSEFVDVEGLEMVLQTVRMKRLE